MMRGRPSASGLTWPPWRRTSSARPPADAGTDPSPRAHAAALVAKAVTAGSFDVVTDLAAELPLLVLSDVLGVPAQDRHLLYRWSNQLVGFDEGYRLYGEDIAGLQE